VRRCTAGCDWHQESCVLKPVLVVAHPYLCEEVQLRARELASGVDVPFSIFLRDRLLWAACGARDARNERNTLAFACALCLPFLRRSLSNLPTHSPISSHLEGSLPKNLPAAVRNSSRGSSLEGIMGAPASAILLTAACSMDLSRFLTMGSWSTCVCKLLGMR